MPEPLAAAWEAQADAWARWVRAPGGDPWNARFNWPAFADLLPPPGRLTVDLGCGEGRAGLALAPLGHRLLGVDAAPTMAAHARASGAYADVVRARADRLPLGAGAADLVVAFMSLMDMDELEPVLAEVARVLGPGGRLCAAVLHPFTSVPPGVPYAAEHRLAEPHTDAELDIVFHAVHRPLAAYADGLAAAGLRIERLAEPVPTEALAREVPRLEKARLRPPFLHFRAVRA